jgi:hypothetical protein
MFRVASSSTRRFLNTTSSNRQSLFNTTTIRSYSKPLFFTTSHEWAQQRDGNVVRSGISDVAQHKLGEIIHLEFHSQVRFKSDAK